jgi:hypothetical protein
VDGDWARDVRRECGWLVVRESRERASAHTVRLAVEVFRAREPSGAPPRVFLMTDIAHTPAQYEARVFIGEGPVDDPVGCSRWDRGMEALRRLPGDASVDRY